jgi:hypothetical protein
MEKLNDGYVDYFPPGDRNTNKDKVSFVDFVPEPTLSQIVEEEVVDKPTTRKKAKDDRPSASRTKTTK